MSDTTFARVVYPSIGVPATTADADREARADVRGHAAGYAAGLRAADAEATARRTAFEAGFAARTAELEAQHAEALRALRAAATAFAARAEPVLAEAKTTLVAAAVQLAEAVVGYEIRASRPVAVTRSDGGSGDGREGRSTSGAHATVERALASVDRTIAVSIRLSPADAAAVAADDLGVPVVADPGLRDGDAVVDLPDGIVDARIRAALDRARNALGIA